MGDYQHLDDASLARLAKIEEGAAEPDFRYHRERERRLAKRIGLPYRGTSRWVLMAGTTPSGKTLFRCECCYRFSVGPDKVCPAGCEDPG